MIRLALATLAGWAAGFLMGAWVAAASQRERAWVCLRCRERVALGDVHGCPERPKPLTMPVTLGRSIHVEYRYPVPSIDGGATSWPQPATFAPVQAMREAGAL
jgi:hypothetical protein